MRFATPRCRRIAGVCVARCACADQLRLPSRSCDSLLICASVSKLCFWFLLRMFFPLQACVTRTPATDLGLKTRARRALHTLKKVIATKRSRQSAQRPRGRGSRSTLGFLRRARLHCNPGIPLGQELADENTEMKKADYMASRARDANCSTMMRFFWKGSW